MNLIKKQDFFKLLLLCLIFTSISHIGYAQENLPDSLAQKPNGKEMEVKFTREDCNFLYYQVQKGGQEIKVEWSKVLSNKYGEESPMLIQARDALTGVVPNFTSAFNAFERVISDKNLSKWQKDEAVFKGALCQISLGALDKAKERLLSIKNDSRYFYPAKLEMIKTLPDKEKVQAMRDLLKGTEVVGPFKFELSLMLVERLISDGLGAEAKQAFAEAKKLNTSTDKYTITLLDEYQIKIDVLTKSFGEAEKKINQYISAGTETGSMRVALGDVLLNKGDKEAFFEYLRGRVDFEDVKAEAGYKAGKLFYELWQEDKINNAEYITYARRELNLSRNAGDMIWSSKAQKMLDQLK